MKEYSNMESTNRRSIQVLIAAMLLLTMGSAVGGLVRRKYRKNKMNQKRASPDGLALFRKIDEKEAVYSCNSYSTGKL